MEDNFLLMVIAMFIASLIMTLLIVLIIRRRSNTKPVVASSNRDSALQPRQPYKQQEENGIWYAVYNPVAGKQPASFHLYCGCNSTLRLQIKREGTTVQLFKSWNINSELQTGDRQFDNDFYLVTEQHKKALILLRRHHAREAITKLFAKGYTHIDIDGSAITATKAGYAADGDIYPQQLQQDAMWLLQLQQQLVTALAASATDTPPTPANFRENPFNTPWGRSRIVGYLFAVMQLSLLVPLLVVTIENYPLIDPMDLISDRYLQIIITVVVTIWLLIRLLRGRSISHVDILITCGATLLFMPVNFYSVTAIINGNLDSSAVTEYPVAIYKTYMTTSDDNESYYMQVASWRRGSNIESISISYYDYSTIDPATEMAIIATKQGYYGYEWLVDYQIVDRH